MINNNMTIKTSYSPCKDCSDRHPTCHTTCKKYALYKSNMDSQNKLRKQYSTPLISRSDFVGIAKHRNRHTNRQISQYMDSKHHA